MSIIITSNLSLELIERSREQHSKELLQIIKALEIADFNAVEKL